jgi:hypothetical protein
MGIHPARGSVELWSFGASNLSGTTGSAVPVISPRQLRDPTSSPDRQSAATPQVINAPPVHRALATRGSDGSVYPTLTAIALAMLLAVAAIAVRQRRARHAR